MEIGNSVFMEYKKKDDGSFEKLAQRNVDFGGGLERITAAENGDPDIFNIDILKGIVDKLKIKGILPDVPDEMRVLRVVTDHLRASIFLISDGVVPSGKGRGSVFEKVDTPLGFVFRALATDSRWFAK